MSEKLSVIGFGNRGTEQEPFGFIDFSDGLRVGYAPGVEELGQRADWLGQGLFEAKQPYGADGELTSAHISLARIYVAEHSAK